MAAHVRITEGSEFTHTNTQTHSMYIPYGINANLLTNLFVPTNELAQFVVAVGIN